jgi:MATE family multidrug resistance protein
MRIGLYGAILESLGWWNLHICFLFSGYLGTDSIATQVVVMQIKNFTTMIPTGIAFAASGFIGNCIGMNQVDRAKKYAEVSIIYSMFVTFFMLLVFAIFATPISFFFTTDPVIAEDTRACFWSLFLYIFFSTIKGVQNGVVRALGMQKSNSILTLLFAYGVGIPLAGIFCFLVGMGLPGMWFGIAIANGFLIVAIQKLIKEAEWEKIATN